MSFCIICSAKFPKGTEHECPPGVAERFAAQEWTRYVQNIYHARGPGRGKAAALRLAQERMPAITKAQLKLIASGDVEWTEIYSWFGIGDEVQP